MYGCLKGCVQMSVGAYGELKRVLDPPVLLYAAPLGAGNGSQVSVRMVSALNH